MPRRAISNELPSGLTTSSRIRALTKSASMPPNLNPPRVPRNMLTSFAYFTVAPPLVLARRLKGRTYHEGWTFRNEVTTGCLKYTLGSGNVASWRRLMKMAETTGRMRSRKIRVEPIKHDDVEGYWITLKESKPQPSDLVFMYFHGGGFVTGTPLMHSVAFQKILRLLKKNHQMANVSIFAVKYPLAPESTFPSQPDAALKAYKYLLDVKKRDPATIIVGGDSAGGNLSLSLIQKLRENNLPEPRALVLNSPWVEVITEIPSHATKADTRRDYLAPRCAKPFAEAIIGSSGVSITDPLLSPTFADLTGYPPMMVCWGGVELFREQIEAFVDKAKAANVNVAEYIDPDMPHVFSMLLDFYPKNAKAALESMCSWIAWITTH